MIRVDKHQSDRIADLRRNIIRMHSDGETQSGAAMRLGVSHHVVLYHSKKIGIAGTWNLAVHGSRRIAK